MMEQLMSSLAGLGPAELQNTLTKAGEYVLEETKNAHAWKKILVGTGDFFLQNEKEESAFFQDLSLALSEKNLSRIARELKSGNGYELKQKLQNSFMDLMRRYEIPNETAESYTFRIICTVLEQLAVIDPDKYDQYFLQEWKDEQNRNFLELQNRLDKMSRDLVQYNREEIDILSSGEMDLNLKRSTRDASLGIEFFVIDDECFMNKFEEKRYEEALYIRGRSREETIYCILNELWRLDDRRPIYVVMSLKSWNKLKLLDTERNVYIPWFYADEITAIENNTNIFVLDENTPVFDKTVLELRPRTRATLAECLKEAGMESDKVNALLEDTHGLYIQMKKKLLNGEYLKRPLWMDGISSRAQKTCLLIGSWEETDGDKLIIEYLYGYTYERFLEEILPYTTGEDPFLYVIKRNGSVYYYLASTENIWGYLDVQPNEPIWERFLSAFQEVLKESENLLTYDPKERLSAQFRGEKLFWSKTIRNGMLKTLLIKGAYKQDPDIQPTLDHVVAELLYDVKTEKQWKYISGFWKELCEISPNAVLARLDIELKEETGLLSLFRNQSDDFLFGQNVYINILWGAEQFLVQKDYFWSVFRWLLKLDSHDFEYKSNSTRDIFKKVFCARRNFSVLETAEDKIRAAETAFELDGNNAWNYLLSSTGGRTSIVGELSAPKYREYVSARPLEAAEMRKTWSGYFKLLIKHMDYLPERWKQMIDLSVELPEEWEKEAFELLLFELGQMSAEEVMQIKNHIRHLIYRHRYYASSDWSMSEDKVDRYEKLLDEIHIQIPEYEFYYLFSRHGDYPLLYPVPYDETERTEKNETQTQELIQEKLSEFQSKGYDLKVLARVCSQESASSLGICLARYWNDGKWDSEVLASLLAVQKSGDIAVRYLEYLRSREDLPYYDIIEDLSVKGCSSEVLAKIYRVEAEAAKQIPIVTDAPDTIKKEFWKSKLFCSSSNYVWAMDECRKYASVDVYLDQLQLIHSEQPLSPDQIFECFEGIERMPHSGSSQLTEYHLEQLISVIQDAFIEDTEKCSRIAQLEIFFMNILDWAQMRCFHRMIEQSPELLAQLIEGAFRKDHETPSDQPKDQSRIHNMYTLYDKAHFCPAECNGKVLYHDLEQWVDQYRLLLIKNDQESLFTSTLGRLFSFSPLGEDGHEPCEAVRKMIERFGDDKLLRSYCSAVYNRRGVFSPSAGTEEARMAEEFKENALYLESRYPMTARIFYDLYDTYMREADRERKDAENGWN